MLEGPSPAPSRYARGLAMLRDAERHVVGGVKRMNRLDDPEHFPLFFSCARGPYAWDVDGHRYIDLIAGKGSILLGAADPRVNRAVQGAMDDGCMLPLTGETYPRAAAALCRLVPSVEKVKFFRTGSCAVSAAVRLARAFTGRRKVLSAGYHGWHDWFIEDRRPAPGDGAPVIDFFYDLPTLAELAARYQDDLAAVVVTPEPSLIDDGWVRQAAETARAAGAVFVLDEMKTGFRFGRGGYQEIAGVKPDLSTFGKAIANGFALSALGGRGDILAAEDRTHVSGTYETESVGLAAGLATLEILEEIDYAPLHAAYAGFVSRMNQAFEAHGVAARAVGSAGNAQILFEDDATAVDFYRRAAAAGVLFYCFDDVNLTFPHVALLDEIAATLRAVVAELPRTGARGLSPAAVHRYLARHRVLPKEGPIDHPLAVALHARLLS